MQLQQYLSAGVTAITRQLGIQTVLTRVRGSQTATTVLLLARMCLLAGAIFAGISILILFLEAGAQVTGVFSASQPTPGRVMTRLVVQGLGLLGGTLAYLRWIGVSPIQALRVSRPSLTTAVLGGLSGLGLFCALLGLDLLAQTLPVLEQPAEHSLAETVTEHPVILLALIVLTPVLLAPAEEALFRGLIQTRLKGRVTSLWAVIGGTAVFTLFHIPSLQGPGTVVSLAFVLASGLTFGWLLERTNTLLAPVFAHTVYNILIFTVTYVTL